MAAGRVVQIGGALRAPAIRPAIAGITHVAEFDPVRGGVVLSAVPRVVPQPPEGR